MLKINVSLLVVGNLGESGKFSLQSIIDLTPKRICYVADKQGESWIRSIINFNKLSNVLFCRHIVPSSTFDSLGITQIESHRVFGTEEFIKITPLKWTIISQVIEKHTDVDLIVFSDLDVIWFNFLTEYFKKQDGILAQNDFRPITNEKYFCTGIMYWFPTVMNGELCEKIYEFQTNKILQGELIPDEIAFNQYIEKVNLLDKIKSLPIDNFVIGHRAKALLRSRNQVLRSASAFHANYFVGDFQKNVVLYSVASNRTHGTFWRFGLVLIYVFKIKDRLISNALKSWRLNDRTTYY